MRLFIHKLEASCFIICSKSANIKLQQVLFSQTFCNFMNSTDLLQLVDNLQQASKIHNLQQVCGVSGCVMIYYSTSFSSSVDFIKLPQVSENQTCCILIFADLLQAVRTTCIKVVDEPAKGTNLRVCVCVTSLCTTNTCLCVVFSCIATIRLYFRNIVPISMVKQKVCKT